MAQLLQQAQQMQLQLVQAQEELAAARIQGTAGGGLVTATVTGAGEVIGLTIDPAAFDPAEDDALATLADLVLAAIRDAGRAAAELQADRMGPLTETFGLPGAGA